MAHKVQGFIFVRVVGLLEDRHVVDAALVQIPVFVHIDRVDFDPDVAKIPAGDFDSFADVADIGVFAALAGQQEDLLHAGLRDDLHFVLDLLEGELFAADVVVTVETAVNTVVLAVIGNVDGGKNIDRVSKVIPGQDLCLARHLLEKWSGGRGEQCLEILNGAALITERPHHVLRIVAGGVIVLHLSEDLVLDVGVDDLHSLHIFHVIRSEGRILLQTVLSRQHFGRQRVTVDKIDLIFFIHIAMYLIKNAND